MTHDISRRHFLKAAAAGALGVAALGLSGCGAAAPAESTANPAPIPDAWDLETDVLIIGGGGTGVAAAVEAAESGARTLVIEKTSIMGGSTIMSGGMMMAAGTHWQQELADCGDDTAEDLYQYYMGCYGEVADPELVKDMAYSSADEIAWAEDCGIQYVTCFAVKDVPGYSQYIKPRIHLPGDGTTGTAGIPGLGWLHVNPIWARAEAAGAEIKLNCPAAGLIVDGNGAVIGAEADDNGTRIMIKANRGVVLATSGFDHNEEMAKALSSSQYVALTSANGSLVGSAVGNTGDGIRMGMAVGAGLAGIGGALNVSLNGNIGRDPTSNLGGPTTGITVNKYGQRFVNEWTQYGYYMRACFSQDGHICYTVTDQNAVDREGGLAMGFSTDDLSAEVASGAVIKADTIAELAQAAGIDAQGLQQTLDTWNADAANGVDQAFGKTEGCNPIETGPFYAARVLTYNLGSLGGLKINLDAQVCRFDGTPIERLFAGGLCTGGWCGTFYPGSGTAVMSTVHWGRKAGRNAAAQQSWS